MADTYSSNLRVRLPETGQYNNSWGTVLNSEALNLLDQAITGQSTVDLTGAPAYSLQALANGAASESRQLTLKFIGAPGGAAVVTVPGTVTKKLYLVDNQCGQQITLKYSGSVGTVIASGIRKIVWCDGAEVYGITSTDADTLDGFTAADLAKIANYNVFTKGFSTPFVELTDIANIQVDCTLSNRFQVTLQGNRNIDLNDPHDGQTIEVWVTQDGTGGRELVWPLNVQFSDGIDPGLSTGGGDTDQFRLTYNGDLDLWIAIATLLSPPAVQTVDVEINENCEDVSIFERAGSPSGAYTVNVTVAVGILIKASSAAQAALDFSGFDNGSIVNLTNRGYVHGKGGEGGFGAAAMDVSDSTPAALHSENGRPGGNAIKGPGAGRTFNITNAQGFIWGGGGGGGGGGVTFALTSFAEPAAAGGGGGGGAGSGRGGSPGQANYYFPGGGTRSSPGEDGSSGPNGTLGDGGAGNVNTANNVGGAGGNGGDWGTAGDAGVSPSTLTHDVPGGAGGAAGLAIDLNGGTVSFVSGSGAPHVVGSVA